MYESKYLPMHRIFIRRQLRAVRNSNRARSLTMVLNLFEWVTDSKALSLRYGRSSMVGSAKMPTDREVDAI